MSNQSRSLAIQLNPEIFAMLQFSAKSAGLSTEVFAGRCIADFLQASPRFYEAVERIESMEKNILEIAGFVGEIRAAVDILGNEMVGQSNGVTARSQRESPMRPLTK